MRPYAFRLNQQGLDRLFGRLEAKILEVVWSREEATVQDVVDRLGHAAHYKTVMTVMNRLVEKNILERHKVSRAFVYRARWTREALMAQLSRQILDSLIADFGPTVMVQFVEAVAENDRQRLGELASLLEDKLTEGKARG